MADTDPMGQDHYPHKRNPMPPPAPPATPPPTPPAEPKKE